MPPKEDLVGFHGAWATPMYPIRIPLANRPSGTPGLYNLTGNSCYQNASLQCLLHSPPLTTLFLHSIDHQRCDNGTFCARCSLGDLAKKFSGTQELKAIGAHQFASHVDKFCPYFERDEQQDAQEFLLNVIGHMARKDHDQVSEKGSSPSESALMYTPTNKVVGGMLCHELTCKKCKIPRDRFEFTTIFPLQTEGISTVEDALERYVSVETLDVKTDCDNCQIRTECFSRSFIRRAPNVLILQLVSPALLDSSGVMIKKAETASNRMMFSEKLDLAPYMSHEKNMIECLSYTLTGVIVHHGRSVRSGHYTAYVRDGSGSWFLKDDESSKKVPFSKVLTKNAYMLFYSRDLDGQNGPESVEQSQNATCKDSKHPKGNCLDNPGCRQMPTRTDARVTRQSQAPRVPHRRKRPNRHETAVQNAVQKRIPVLEGSGRTGVSRGSAAPNKQIGKEPTGAQRFSTANITIGHRGDHARSPENYLREALVRRESGISTEATGYETRDRTQKSEVFRRTTSSAKRRAFEVESTQNNQEKFIMKGERNGLNSHCSLYNEWLLYSSRGKAYRRRRRGCR